MRQAHDHDSQMGHARGHGEREGVPRPQRESYSLLSVAGDLRVTQVVNGVKGAHFVLSKNVIRETR
ncbi:hypothetical protein [Streptomyces sp. NPDC002545]